MGERSVKVHLKGDVSDFNRAMIAGAAGAKTFSKSLDTSTDRSTMLVQSLLAVGPALVPITAAAIPAISGLTNQLAFAAVGAGVTALAFSGVGSALKAVNDYSLEPTVANFEKMHETMATLGPAGQDFVVFLQSIRPEMQNLQNLAQAGLLPGAEKGLTELMDLLPQVERIVFTVSSTIGDLIAEAGDNLNDPRWVEFFDFIQTEARPTMLDMGHTLGNLTEGFANLWMAFDPISDNFSTSFLQLSRDFAEWTDGLSATEGFQEFVEYIARVGPKVWDTLGAIGNGLLQVVEAAAPVGEVALPVIEALADGLAAVADSKLGPIIIGVVSLASALSRLQRIGIAANSSALGGLLGKTGYGGLGATLKGATTATNELRAAQQKLTTSAIAARDAQFALIPTAGKRKALATYSTDLRAVAAAEAKAASATRARRIQTGQMAAGAAGLAFVMSDLDDKMGLSNTASLALMGSIAGPWGAAIGAGVGLAMDFAAANDSIGDAVDRANKAVSDSSLSIQQQIAAVDASLETLDAKRKKIIADQVGAGAFAGGADTSEVDEASKKLRDTRKELAAAAQEQKFEEAGLSAAMRDASASTRDQVEATLDLIGVHNTLSDLLLQERGGIRAFEAAIDDASESVKKNGKTHDVNTRQGRANQEQLDKIADAYNKLTPAQQSNERTTKRARTAFINSAIAMGYTRAQARRLAAAVLDIPDKREIDIRAKTEQARRDLMALQGYVDGMHGKTVKIHVEGGTPGGITKADGGYISGPGGPRSDSIPAMLSNGEYVINAAATKRNLSLLHQINAQKFADGGPVASRLSPNLGSLTGSSASAQDSVALIDYDRLAQSMAGLGISVQVGIDKRTSAKIVQQGSAGSVKYK